MAILKLNELDIIGKTTTYNITRQDITRTFEAENGDVISYLIRKGKYSISLKIVCDGDFYNQFETVLENNEITATFTYSGIEHTAIMQKTSFSSSCKTLYGSEFWEISLNLQECRRE